MHRESSKLHSTNITPGPHSFGLQNHATYASITLPSTLSMPLLKPKFPPRISTTCFSTKSMSSRKTWATGRHEQEWAVYELPRERLRSLQAPLHWPSTISGFDCLHRTLYVLTVGTKLLQLQHCLCCCSDCNKWAMNDPASCPWIMGLPGLLSHKPSRLQISV